MKKGPLISLIVGLAAIAAVVAAFVNGASPYVSIAQARRSDSTELHVAGTIVPGTIRTVTAGASLQFTLRDATGNTIGVDYTGDLPENLKSAKQVVAIGGVRGNRFESKQLLIKCPSKYQASNSSS